MCARTHAGEGKYDMVMGNCTASRCCTKETIQVVTLGELLMG